MTLNIARLLFLVILLSLAPAWRSAQNPSLTTSATQAAENAAVAPTPETKFTKVFSGLSPRDGDCGLLLGFDTDTSDNAEGYGQFYDFEKPDTRKIVPYKTLFVARKNNQVALAVNLDFLVSPQKNGFVYFGQARYFEPQPRVENPDLGISEDSGFKPFGFDYTRIWHTPAKSQMASAEAQNRRAIKAEIDAEFNKSKEKEWSQNISDHEKISFISNGFYVKEGFWSQITGGAAFFQAYTKNSVVSLDDKNFSSKLKSLYSPAQIENGFKKVKEEFGEARWGGSEDIGYVENSTYTLARLNGETHVLGLILVDGNAHRSFHADADFGAASKSIVSYDNPKLNFAEFKEFYPTILDVFVSPNQNTVFILTKEEIIGIDVQTQKEVFKTNHNLQFNKVVMVEWATNEFVQKWENELKPLSK